jgi:DNA-binding CsgD family transcriptional regulator
MTTFAARQLDAVLQVTSSATATGQPLLDALAESLADVSGADSVTVFELEPRAQAIRGLASVVRDGGSDDDEADAELFWSAYPDSICSWTDAGSPWFGKHPARALLAPETAYPSWRAFQESRIMRTYGRAVGLGHYVLVPLSSDPSTSRRVLLNRPGTERAFSDDEITMLRLLQPHLDAAVGRALSGRPAEEVLTARELEILAYVRGGRSTQDIASALWVSPSTVRKHLENVYAKLGVHSRAEAVAHVYGHRSSTDTQAV